MDPQVTKQIEILKAGIRQDAPLVADFFDVKTPLKTFVENIFNYSAGPVMRERQQLFKQVVKKKLLETFTQEEVNQANIDWDEDWKLNIVEHHAFLNHPILLGTHLISQINQLPTNNPHGIIAITDSGVPLNNFFHKRGLKFQGKQINIFPHKLQHALAYATPTMRSFTLLENAKRNQYPDDAMHFLESIDQILMDSAKHPLVHSYRDQVKRVNFQLWKLLFPPEMRQKVPDLFLIPNEEVAIEMLHAYLHDTNNIFTRILFDPNIRESVIKHFDGITGCWETASNKGSFFFWGIDEHHEAVRLVVDGNALAGNGFTIPLEPNAILEALDSKRIFAGMFLVYGMSIFHCGVRPLVGYGSMNYQTRMKEAWSRFLQASDPEEAKRIAAIPTDGFIGGPKVTFAWDENAYQDLFALDIIFRGGLTEKYLDHLRHMPFNELLLPAVPDMYVSYVKPEHKQDYSITPNDLMGESFSWLQKFTSHP